MNFVFRRPLAEHGLRGLGQIVHRKMHAGQLAAFDPEIARLRRPRAQHDGIEIFAHHLRFVVVADVCLANELDALLLQQADAAHHHFFFAELHVGNAVHQQPARTIGALEHGYRMPGSVELLRGRQACGPGTHHCDSFAGARRRWFGVDPTLFEATLDDGVFDIFDSHRRRIDAEHAGAFAGRGAHAAGEFRKIVGLVQAIERFAPETPINEIVPLGNEIVHRAA